MAHILVIFLGLFIFSTAALAEGKAVYTKCGKDQSANSGSRTYVVQDVCMGLVAGTSQELVLVRYLTRGKLHNEVLFVTDTTPQNGGINPAYGMAVLTLQDKNGRTSQATVHTLKGQIQGLEGSTPSGVNFSARDFQSTFPRN